MVAKIRTGVSIRGMLHFNENKVNAGQAKLILSSGFAGDIDKLNFNQKLQRFQHLTELKPNVKTNALHISLNFHSSEKLDNLKLQQIALGYIEQIGFSDQPFLVYRHDDAAHQHVHITTTNITSGGERIDLHNIGRLQSEIARKALEVEFGLMKAESKEIRHAAVIKMADLGKAKYGVLPTKRAISNVVGAVFRDYQFTSLAEYNAALKCFNVVAFRGAEDTAMFEKKGLMYSLLDKTGKPIGVPIKSSAFFSKPTLRNLEKLFVSGQEKRKATKDDLKQRIEEVLAGADIMSREKLDTALKKQGIQVAFRENEQGRVYGITFIDHRNKTVFNGSDLGKRFSAKAVTDGFNAKLLQKKVEEKQESRLEKPAKFSKGKSKDGFSGPPKPPKLLEMLLGKTTEDGGVKVPKRKKKRRKRQITIEQTNQ